MATTLAACSAAGGGASDDGGTVETVAGDSRPAGDAGCSEVPPDTGLRFGWVPVDLPLPSGTYPVQQLQKPPGITFDSGIFATPLSLEEFARFAERQWVPRGYLLGARDAEPGEKEATFLKDDRYGSYRVRPYCGGKWSELYIGYGFSVEPTLGSTSPVPP